MTLPANFIAKTKASDCIVWTGALNSTGYPCFAVAGVSQLAHRLAYEDAHGPIGEGMTVDHTCRVRHCVNPDHLEVVTVQENNRRSRESRGYFIGGQCARQHLLTAETTRRSRGRLVCLACEGIYRSAHEARAAESRGSIPGAAVRAWAVANGYSVKPRGTIAAHIREAYEQAMARDAA